MSAHTPGPWKVGDYGRILSLDGQTIEVEGVALPMVSTPVSKANARLIAAAPEMLKELKRSADGWNNAIELGIIPEEHRMSATILRDAARAAIAKAEGRS